MALWILVMVFIGLLGLLEGFLCLLRTLGWRIILDDYQVWNKREYGRSAYLDDALDLALLRGARRTIQVQLSVGLSDRIAEFMGEHDISII